MKVNPIARPAQTQTEKPAITFNTQRSMNPALLDKLKAAQSVAPPPSPAPVPTQPAQNITNEGAIAQPAEATNQSLSPHFAALARKERQMRKAQQEFKAAQETWTKQQQDYIPKSSLQSDPLKALAEAGVTYDRLVELQLGQPEANPQALLQGEIEALKAELANFKTDTKSAEEKRTIQQREQAVAAIRQDVELLVDADPAYETIKATNNQAEVVALIEAIFDAEGKIISVEDAARQVEEHLVEATYEQIKKLSELEKIKAKLVPVAQETQVVAQPIAERLHQRQQPQTPKTLTNAQGVHRPLSARDRAIQAFERAQIK